MCLLERKSAIIMFSCLEMKLCYLVLSHYISCPVTYNMLILSLQQFCTSFSAK